MKSNYRHQLTLVSHVLCPYVQRSVMALEELGIEYKRIDIDLQNPPDWFSKLSPLGKVPLLLVDDDIVLFESAVIAEFINEIADGDLLLSDPIGKAQQKAWIEFASATLDNIGQLYSAKGEKAFGRSKSALQNKLLILGKNLNGSRFFSGDDFSLVDAAFAPVFRYFDLFEKLLGEGFHETDSELTEWRNNLAQRASVIKAVSPDYAELLTAFVAGQRSYLGELASGSMPKKSAA